MTQKTNLYSLYCAKNTLDESNFHSLLKFHNIEIREAELDDLMILIETLIKPRIATYRAFEYFSFGFIIPQIGKEFDLLRFGTKSIVNIELKSTTSDEKIKKQLKRNKYYLKFLNLDLYLFTFVSSTKQFFKLDLNDDLIEIDISEVITLLNRQFVNTDVRLSEIFNPSDFLVSPFNSTEKFIKKEYFLTQEQDEFKKSIIKKFEIDNKQFAVVKGEPGSGKTLLTYDLAEYFSSTKRTAIIHCANLNDGQLKLNDDFGWNIYPIKNKSLVLNNNFEIIIIDECQRIKKNQLDEIIEYSKKQKIKIIFSYDEKQVLHAGEKNEEIVNYIESTICSEVHTLKAKIRTNKEITAFIKSLFDRNRIIEQYPYNSIELLYLNNMDEAKVFMSSNLDGDWTKINYTPSLYNTYKYENYNVPEIGVKTHSIIGQEFEKVIAVIDQDFAYVNDELVYTKKCYYNPSLMLYQNITRARSKVKVIIIGNAEILKRCLQILNVQKK